MAGFTSLALVGAGLLAGAGASKLAGRKNNQQAETPPLAPGPTGATPNALAPAAPPILNPADANAKALAAGQKQRKRSAQGSLLTTGLPKSTTMPVAGRLNRPTLLGS